jgi:hypothetical protein
MKKAITILAILAIVVAAVFADTLPENNASETHQIRLKTVVGSVLPQFRLVAQENVENATTAQTNTGETPVKFTDRAEYGVSTPIVYQVSDISTGDIDVTFTAELLNKAKTGGTYTLAFNAGAFTDVWKVENGVVTKNNSVAATTKELAKAVEGAATTGIVIGDPSDETITIKFNGQECVEGNIANYHVVYEQDNKVIDNNGTGYFADVTLTITFDGVRNPQPQNP